MSQGILDTSTFISMADIDESELPDSQQITAITLAELAAGVTVATSPDERVKRQSQVQRAEADYDALPFDELAARSFAQVSASLRRAGRKAKARTFDALIAAIALANGLPIYTCIPDDFEHIDGLKVIPVRRRS